MSLRDLKGVWIWELAKLQRDYLEILQKQGCKRVFLKVYDGYSAADGIWRFQANPEVIQKFNNAGIEVFGWGYHYGEDVDEEFEAAEYAQEIGCCGYILDVEQEFKNPATHRNLESVLERIVHELTNPGFVLGYTSFGHAGFHSEIPFQMLNRFCTIAMPQIYFEKFGFAKDEQEVRECMASYANTSAVVWPIFGSESDTKVPATPQVLQMYLDRFVSSSIWRLPNAGERGEAFKLKYGTPTPIPDKPKLILKPLGFELSFGLKGEMVLELQKALNSFGYALLLDGDFGNDTLKAVRSFQSQNALEVDGVVGRITWEKLGGKWAPDVHQGNGSRRVSMANLAKDIARNAYELHSKESFVWRNMVAPLVPAMKKLGHIGDDYVYVNWCACFVTYCARRASFSIPDQPDGFWATMALVDSWVFWAKKNGKYFERRDINPQKGDIVIFDWQTDGIGDHIGIVDSYTVGENTFTSIEGNATDDRISGVFTHRLAQVKGWIRL